MWNDLRTDVLDGMVARSIMITGGGGDQIHAYTAVPDGNGPFGGVVITHHAPGWDEFIREMARRLAQHGFITIAPNLFERFGHGTPDDVAARARGEGGVSDASVIADAEASMNWIKAQPTSNGKVGVIGPCSGGRHALLVGSSLPGINAVVDLWGGNVVVPPERLTEKQPVAVVDLTPNLTAPLLGIFGNEDTGPSPDQVNQHEAVLQQYGKTYMFHRYDGAGHGIFYYHMPTYRQQQAMDGWNKVLDWFTPYLA